MKKWGGPHKSIAFVGEGAAREPAQFSPEGGNGAGGLCRDAGAFLEKRAEKHFQNK